MRNQPSDEIYISFLDGYPPETKIEDLFKLRFQVSDRVVGIMLMFIASMLAAYANVLCRVLKDIHFSKLMVWHGFVGLVLSLIFIVLEAFYNYSELRGFEIPLFQLTAN